MGMSVEAAGNGKSRKGPSPEINITPLVDVVLVLLIIFMVVTPQLEAGEAVEPPSVSNPDEKAKSKLDPINVTFTMSGKYFVEKDQYDSEPSLRERLDKEHKASPQRRVVLKADRSQNFGKVRTLFGLCKEVGFSGVSLVVSERAKTK